MKCVSFICIVLTETSISDTFEKKPPIKLIYMAFSAAIRLQVDGQNDFHVKGSLCILKNA